MPERVSIRHVAKMAQVSPMTVTRVLRGHDTVAQDTRQRVLAAVRQTEYIPVRSAVQNRHVTNHVLGYVPYHVNLTQNRIDSETYSGVSYAAYQQGYDLLVMLRQESDWMGDRSELRFLDRRSDGFVFISTHSGEWQSVFNALVQYKIPTVVCYRRDVPKGIAWVDPDNEAIIGLAVEALLRKGHKRIAYLTAPHKYETVGRLAGTLNADGNHDDSARRGIFLKRMQQQEASGCRGTLIENTNAAWKLQPSALAAIRERKITGVVCVNDLIAVQLFELAKNAGLKIPEDLSIVGVDDTEESKQIGLSSVKFAFSDLGTAAVNAWMRLAAGEAPEDCNVVIPVTLQERKSVGVPA